MEAFIPVSIQPLIDAYLRALEPLRTHFYGIYIAGSIALDAFEELASDIDIIALVVYASRGYRSSPAPRQAFSW